MSVMSVMEPLVKRAVTAFLEESRESSKPCRCALCEKDVTALSLSNLPPRYCGTSFWYERVLEEEGQRVAAAVAAASQRVLRAPRHPPEQPESFHAALSLKNFVLEEVARLVVTNNAGEEGECGCERCTTDIMAYALNRYPSKYGVSWRGTCAFPDHQRELIRHEIGPVLSMSAEVVSERPRHEVRR